MENKQNIIIGRKPVLEALKSDAGIIKIYFGPGQKGEVIQEIKSEAKKKKISFAEVPHQKIESFSKGKIHQGIVALLSELKFFSLEEILRKCKSKQFPLLLILEQIQDTHNLGAILRTAEAAGVDGVLITKHNSAPVNETVEKTSAGATSHLMIHQTANVSNTIKTLKQNGFWVVGSTLEDSQLYTSVDYKSPLALILSNEEKGIKRLTAENCDFLVNIPMKGKIQSLNVSVAAGIIMYEISRQRG
ncbi:MAG: 23S rRNA (guanosine(2251)-2'-O)-methyltransferase RlmB [Bacteroidetes bacterium]|nr:23S rRNA (guanosine(2251)-2'-O)-methyltransferase RlmB [Bacteroidota bacterium]